MHLPEVLTRDGNLWQRTAAVQAVQLQFFAIDSHAPHIPRVLVRARLEAIDPTVHSARPS